MADEDKVKVGLEADASNLKTGMAEAASTNKATAQGMAADWTASAASIKTTVTGMTTDIKANMTSVKESVMGIQSAIVGIGAVMAGGAIFSGIINKTIEWTGEVKNLHKALGITSEEASVLNVALTHAGISNEAYIQGARTIARQLAMNSKAFQGLDIDVRNTDGTFKNSQDIMMEVIQKLGDMKEGTDRNVAAAEIFKRSHIDVNELLKLNAAAFEQARQKAADLHLVVGPEGEAQARKYKESLNDLKLVGTSLSAEIGNKVIPVLTKLGTVLLDLVVDTSKASDEHKGFLHTISETGVFNVLGANLDTITDSFIVVGNAAKQAGQYIAAALSMETGNIDQMLEFMKEAQKVNLWEGTSGSGRKRDDYAPPQLPIGDTGTENAPTMPQAEHHKKGPSAYEVAKSQEEAAMEKAKDEAEIAGVKMTTDEKIAIYKQFLEAVEKDDKEQADYEKGLYRLDVEGRKQAAAEKRAIAKTEVDITKESANEAFEAAKARYQREYDLSEQTTGDKIRLLRQEMALEQARYETVTSSLKKEADASHVNWDSLQASFQAYLNAKTSDEQQAVLNAGLAATQYKVEWLKVFEELAKAHNQFTLRFTQLDHQATQEGVKDWRQTSKEIKHSMQDNVNDVLVGTSSMRQAFRSMVQQIARSLLTFWENQLPQAANDGAEAAGTAADNAATQASGSILGMLESVGTALSSIPWYGWVGLAILAGVSSAQSAGNSSSSSTMNRGSGSYYGNSSVGSMPSYDTGSWSVPGDTMAMVHKKELIVSNNGGQADMVRGILSGQVAAPGSGFTHAPTYNVQAIDGKGLGRVLRDNSRDVAQGLYRSSRNLTRQNPSRWGR